MATRTNKQTVKPKTSEVNEVDNNSSVSEDMVDLRKNLVLLDDATKKAWLGKERGYDASVFAEVIDNQEDGKRILFVPGANRVKWFKTDYPTGLIVPEAPKFEGKRVTIMVHIYYTMEDYLQGKFCACNFSTGELNGDTHCVNIIATRAIARTLRDINYDIPKDAHEIPGWTPIRVKGEDGTSYAIPDDALESSIVTVKPPMIKLPTFKNDAEPKEGETHAQAQQETPISKTIENEAPANQKEAIPSPKTSGSKKIITTRPPASEPAQPVVTPEKADAPEEHQQEKTNDTASVVAPVASLEVPETSVSKEKTQKATIPHTVYSRPDVANLLARANEEFKCFEDAASYTCALLGGRTLNEENDIRISYYAKKIIEGGLSDAKLGLASLIVAEYRGLALLL